jgi:hypothetical protein
MLTEFQERNEKLALRSACSGYSNFVIRMDFSSQNLRLGALYATPSWVFQIPVLSMELLIIYIEAERGLMLATPEVI